MTAMLDVLGHAVGRSVLVWCAVAAAATASTHGDKTGQQKGCVPCGTAGRCVPLTSLCDGFRDCPAGEDEDGHFCEVHLPRRRSRANDVEKNSRRKNSRILGPPIAGQPSDSLLERSVRQMNNAPSATDPNSTGTRRSPIIVRTVTSLNSTNTSSLVFIHLPDDEGNHPTLLPSLTRDASLVSNATFLSRVNVNTKKPKPRLGYKHSHAAEECCGHCVRCASSKTCVAHSQLCDGQADCLQMEDEAPAFCQVFLEGRCPTGLGPCNGVCIPWALACTEHCLQRPHFEACYAVRRKQLDISFLNKSSTDDPRLRIPFAPYGNSSHSVLRVALPADPVPQTLDPLRLTRPADSPFPIVNTDESRRPLLPQLHDEFIEVPKLNPSSVAENMTSLNMSAYSSVIYKCSPISPEDKISSLLSANTLLLKSPTKSSFLNINSKDLLQAPIENSNINTLDRLKAALANIHRNLLNLNKTLNESNESRSSKYLSHNYPTITYHCVLASKVSENELNAADFSKDDSDTPGTDENDAVQDLTSPDRNMSSNHSTNGTRSSYSWLQYTPPSLSESESESESTRQVLPVREATPEILQSNTDSLATTYRPPLSELMEMLAPPPQTQTMRPCPPIYTPVAHTCLAALPFPMTWQEAGDVCERLGGQLAEARDISMLTAVAKFLRLNGSGANFWVGGFYDVVTTAWMWRSGAKMKMSTPFWGYRLAEECSELQRGSYSPPGDPACSHHQQAPLKSTKGFCAALDAKFFYFITDQPCLHSRKVLCSHDRMW